MLASALIPAAAVALDQDDILSARLLPGWQTDAGTRMAAVHMVLAADWKTYWRSPGDAGIPPLFDWSGSENLAAVQVHWPRPKVFHLNGMQTIGYAMELVLPVELTPIDPAQPILLRGAVDLGVCRDICIPAALTLSADLSGPGAPDPAIRAALRAQPDSARTAGLTAISCTTKPIKGGLRVTALLDLPPLGGEETVVIEPGRAAVWVSEAVVLRDAGRLTASVDLVADRGKPVLLDRGGLVVTVLGRDRAVEVTGCPAP